MMKPKIELNVGRYLENRAAERARLWAISANSPDGTEDAESPTGETMSSKEWAKQAKKNSEGSSDAAVAAQAAKEAAELSAEAAKNAAENVNVYIPSVNENGIISWEKGATGKHSRTG